MGKNPLGALEPASTAAFEDCCKMLGQAKSPTTSANRSTHTEPIKSQKLHSYIENSLNLCFKHRQEG